MFSFSGWWPSFPIQRSWLFTGKSLRNFVNQNFLLPLPPCTFATISRRPVCMQLFRLLWWNTQSFLFQPLYFRFIAYLILPFFSITFCSSSSYTSRSTRIPLAGVHNFPLSVERHITSYIVVCSFYWKKKIVSEVRQICLSRIYIIAMRLSICCMFINA